MLNDIPIRINRKGVKPSDLAFKIFPLQVKQKLNHRRQKTCDNKENQLAQKLHIQPKNFQTSKMQFRYRRASSSGAARKFPKDFFKNQNLISCKKSKNNRINMPQFLSSQKKSVQKMYCQYNMQTLNQLLPMNINLENLNQEQYYQEGTLQTPKFNTKKNSENLEKDLKVKLKQYLNYKKLKRANQLLIDLQQNQKQESKPQSSLQTNFLQTLNPIQLLKNVETNPKNQNKEIPIKKKEIITKKNNERQLIFKKLSLMKPLVKFQNLQNNNKSKLHQNNGYKDETKEILTCFRIRKF